MEALNILDELQETRSSEYVDAYEISLIYEALGRRDEALRELERACDENSAMLFMLDVDPKFDPLRGEPRFRVVRNRAFSGAGVPEPVGSRSL